MLCEAIRPVIRAFLDDLLDERDYQDVQTHLAGCARCHAYASSVGTLSYRLYELGQTTMPPDFSSAVVYELSKQSPISQDAIAASTPPKGTKAMDTAALVTRLLWAIVLLLAAAMVMGILAVVKSRGVTPPVISVGDERKMQDQPIHWHYHVLHSSAGEIEQVFEDLSLPVLDRSANDFIVDVPREKLQEFMAGIAELRGVVKDYGDIDASKMDASAVRVSIYLE